MSLDEYSSYFDNIDPVSHYKRWTTKAVNQYSSSAKFGPGLDPISEAVKAAFVVSDPVDWGRDIQVCYFPFSYCLHGSFFSIYCVDKFLALDPVKVILFKVGSPKHIIKQACIMNLRF